MLVLARSVQIVREALAELWPNGKIVSSGLKMRTEQTRRFRSAIREDVLAGEQLHYCFDECRCLSAMAHVTSMDSVCRGEWLGFAPGPAKSPKEVAHISSNSCGKPKATIRMGRAPAGACSSSALRNGASRRSTPRRTSSS